MFWVQDAFYIFVVSWYETVTIPQRHMLHHSPSQVQSERVESAGGRLSASQNYSNVFLFFVNLGGGGDLECPSLNKSNQIKWEWAYQSSGMFEGPRLLPEHKSSFIFSQFTWWINSPAECLAPVFCIYINLISGEIFKAHLYPKTAFSSRVVTGSTISTECLAKRTTGGWQALFDFSRTALP